MNDLMSVVQAAKRLSLEDQLKLNKLLCANIRMGNKVRAAGNAIRFNLGDVVQFDGKTRGPIHIQISGFSRDFSKIKGKQVNKGWKTSPGVNWTVGASGVKPSSLELATKV